MDSHGDSIVKLRHLQGIIAEKGKVLVSFSGGVDSSILARVAQDILGKGAECVILDSELMPRRELAAARKIAEEIGIACEVVSFSILAQPDFVSHAKNRCYVCKQASAQILKRIAVEKGIPTVADGVNLSDFEEHRPGIMACDEAGIWHPLVEAGIGKSDVRIIARHLGLPNWEKPPSGCLATRIPYGEAITSGRLQQIERSEDVLQELGFRQVRVRVEGSMARIEVSPSDLERILDLRDTIVRQMKRVGFTYITLDLEGYRPGSLEESGS